MSIAFWVVTTIVILASLHRTAITKDYFSIYTYLLAGVYVPLLLYMAGWSRYITSAPSDDFYLLFTELGIVILLSMLAGDGKDLKAPAFIEPRRATGWAIWLAIIYAAACIAENYLGSGYAFPALNGIDIHTYRAPGLMYLTTAIYAVVAANLMSAMCARSMARRFAHIAAIVGILAIYLAGKAARMSVAQVAIQVVSIALFFYVQRLNVAGKSIGPRVGLATASLATVGIWLFAAIGNDRASGFGVYQINYSNTIGYTGPQLGGDWLGWYYGYFPMSFNNLNLSILTNNPHWDAFGLNTFKFLYFGLLQFDNLFGLDAYASDAASVYPLEQTLVPTGFWNLYYDYKAFAWIPLAACFLFYIWLRRRCTRPQASLADISVYFFWVPTWLFMSFQLIPLEVSMLTSGIAAWLVMRWGFEFRQPDVCESPVDRVGRSRTRAWSNR